MHINIKIALQTSLQLTMLYRVEITLEIYIPPSTFFHSATTSVLFNFSKLLKFLNSINRNLP